MSTTSLSTLPQCVAAERRCSPGYYPQGLIGIDEAWESMRGPNGKRKLALALLCSLAHGHKCGEREGTVQLDVPAIEVLDGGGQDALRVE